MARAQYFVVLHEEEWKIKFNEEHYGPYPTRRDALRAAVDAAHDAGTKGYEAEVLVQGAFRDFRPQWTYGRDPYPPPALATLERRR